MVFSTRARGRAGGGDDAVLKVDWRWRTSVVRSPPATPKMVSAAAPAQTSGNQRHVLGSDLTLEKARCLRVQLAMGSPTEGSVFSFLV